MTVSADLRGTKYYVARRANLEVYSVYIYYQPPE
jgi:hypothetical protein